MKEIKAIVQPAVQDRILREVARHPTLPGVTASRVEGFGKGRGEKAPHRVVRHGLALVEMVKLEIVVSDEQVDEVLDIIQKCARTGQVGDGKIFVSEVVAVVRIRTGERDDAGN